MKLAIYVKQIMFKFKPKLQALCERQKKSSLVKILERNSGDRKLIDVSISMLVHFFFSKYFFCYLQAQPLYFNKKK